MATTEKYVGTPVLRKEDPEFLTGQALYTDDLTVPGMLWMTVVRSPFAHARIKALDASKALAMPGVLAVLSGQAFGWAGPLAVALAVLGGHQHPAALAAREGQGSVPGRRGSRAGRRVQGRSHRR